MLPFRKTTRNRRKGAATIEFAVCLPIIVVIVLGSIEAANMMFLKQTLIQGAYEGAKVAILRESTNAECISAIDEVMDGRSLNGVQISFDPANVETVPPGQVIEVTVSAPGGSNSFLNVNPFRNTLVSAQAFMVKE